jgi:hypothetical protein
MNGLLLFASSRRLVEPPQMFQILVRLVELDQVPLGFRVFKQRLQRHRSP